jgi:TonB family protein
LQKDQQTVVPPAPLKEVKPAFSAAERRALQGEVPVDVHVHVYITESGSVDYAELLGSHSAGRHRELAEAAVFAARRWSFRPARQGSENVPSEAILHFRFRAEEPPPPQP